MLPVYPPPQAKHNPKRAYVTTPMSRPETRPRMMSTTLDHQKGNKLWIHDAVPRNYSYHPFSSEVSGITPAGPGLPTVAMINSARLTGSFGAATAVGGRDYSPNTGLTACPQTRRQTKKGRVVKKKHTGVRPIASSWITRRTCWRFSRKIFPHCILSDNGDGGGFPPPQL